MPHPWLQTVHVVTSPRFIGPYSSGGKRVAGTLRVHAGLAVALHAPPEPPLTLSAACSLASLRFHLSPASVFAHLPQTRWYGWVK